MKPDARRYLAFRFFGAFQWPPVRRLYESTADEDENTVRAVGVVDVFYAESGNRRRPLSAFLRWTPRGGFDGNASWKAIDSDLSKVDQIQTLDDRRLMDLFRDARDSVLLRLDPPSRGSLIWNRRLLFRGGLIFDQYTINRKNNAACKVLPPIERRLLLSRKFAKGAARYYSDLIVGQPDEKDNTHNSSYRFDLALPTITPQFTTGNAQTDAFPFGVIYASKIERLADRPVSIDTLVVGRRPSSLVAIPSDFSLGQLGFSKGRSSGCVEAPSRLWLSDGRLMATRVLAPLGFVTRGTLRVPGALGAHRFSIRFGTKDGVETSIFYRISVAAGASGPWEDGDVAKISGRLHLKVPGLLNEDQFLDVGDDVLPIELEHRYSIADAEIWSVVGGAEPVEHVLAARLGLTGRFSTPWIEPDEKRRSAADLIQNAIRGMRLAVLALESNQSAAPDSSLADIYIAPQTALFSLTADFDIRRSKNGNLDWKVGSGAEPDYRLTMWDSALGADGDPAYKVPADAWLPLLTGRKGGVGCPDLNLIISSDIKHSGDRKCQFRLQPRDVANATSMTAMLAGMSLQTVGSTVNDDSNSADQSHFWFSARKPSSSRIPVGTNSNTFQLPDIFLRLRLLLSRAAPVALTLPWGERTNRPQPLLIVSRQAASTSRFLLDCREVISDKDDRWLQSDLIDQTPGIVERDEYVVLAQEPFGIVRFRSQALEALGSQDNAIVAFYDSDTRQWQLKLTAPTYQYEFPPQVAGESMDKPKRLELHDINPSEEEKLRPAVDDVHRRAVEFRLTPSAEIWIKPSDVERGYVLPQWESGEIFRQAGELGMGVGLEALRAEFLYGLSVGIKPSEELGPSRRARIAEIEALVGRLPNREATVRLDDDVSLRWSALHQTLSRRPERLEIWSADPDSDVAFAPARFQRGTLFALRSTALHRPPIIDGEVANEPETGKLRFDNKHGLSGGALWPLESKNFFNTLLANPASTRGSIERVALSPIGGDADQKAEFLENRLAIISETRNGFVQRQKIEIIGRIAVFWHRAKHVVVYERTVNPTAQFAPKGEKAETRTRRPVLRKVSEYIELLEPVRNYPDFPAELESSGFLRSVQFNQKIINVDSEWSEDTGEFGWKIPLWNRYSATQRPQVYPRPDIGFVTNAEGEGDAPTATQECLEPENLYFFADATPGAGDNTDEWISRAGIDYSRLPFPTDELQRQSDIGPEEDARAPSARRIPRGFRRFTWRLAPASARTMVNAGRSGKPLYVGLESITFMRPRPEETTKITRIAEALRDSSSLEPPHPSAQLKHWHRPGEGPPELQGLDEALVGFLNAVETGGDIKGSAQLLWQELKDTGPLLQQDPKLRACVVQLNDYWQKVQQFSLEDRSKVLRCDKLIDDFIGSLRRKQLLILEEIRSWGAYDDTEIVPIGRATRLDRLVETIANLIGDELRPVLTETVKDVTSAGSSLAAARQIARDWESEVTGILQRAARELSLVRTSYDRSKPWSSQRLLEFQQKIRNVQQGIAGDLEATVFEIQHRLAAELDEVAQQIASDAAYAVCRIIDGESSIAAALGGVETAAKAYLQSIKYQIEKLKIHELAALASAKLDEAMAQDDGTYRALFESMKVRLTELDQATSTIESRCDALGQILGQGSAPLEQASSEVIQLCTNLIRDAATWLVDSIRELESIADPALQAICDEIKRALQATFELPTGLLSYGGDLGRVADGLVDTALTRIDEALRGLQNDVRAVFNDIDRAGAWVEEKLKGIAIEIGPDKALTLIVENIVEPAVRAALSGLVIPTVVDLEFQLALRQRLRDLSTLAEEEFKGLSNKALGGIATIKAACEGVGGTIDTLEGLLKRAEEAVKGQIDAVFNKLDAALQERDINKAIAQLKDLAKTIDVDVRKIGNDLADALSSANAYVDRVSEAIGAFNSGDPGSLPNKVLRLYAAAATAPAMPNLDFARERLAYYYNDVNKIIDTTKAEAWFGKLGDDLKALGLSLPFSQIGDSLIPFDLRNYDIGRIFRNFGGLKLDTLFKGYRVPDGVKDAIRITHDFEKKLFRAWVQIDVNAPMKGRKSLFSIGPFQLDFVDTDFIAKVRLDASKDTDKVEQTGSATLVTDIEAVVGGQTMVTMRRVTIHYDKASGLKVDFDPKGIRLNPAFQFVQDTLGSLFPSELGGLKVIKQSGVPVGVEHEFSMPPVSLMYATSGVSNISISNSFSLIAFPDFVISDRFSLSKPETPFLFSLFILGGTGYVSVDTEYRPFRNELMVVVEAAAGGSASLGFAFGPVSGQVYITLSVALAYRKLIGTSGGGLTVSLVLLVAGNVSVAGIATVYMGLLLRLAYRNTGQIDAAGTLTVSIRISRFFTLSARANAKYTLRGGKAQTVTSVDTNATIDDPKLAAAARKAEDIMGARHG
ncbi:Kinesin-like protein (plasmid) [Sinorhizobium sojae CCBAU 05684]|uniref:Kinesin-like protein n=1 Tax=Sinorhizobium sojae CCBAU 05684 TaxID=716928 RepID=A0A249PLJ0_9HYPH|nr:hypothetical protein [Sinorhizobium sojae]ASY66554.1 Kinesin-like protein [Sinorhizobium sojae CCBAU 05684]